MLARQVEWSKRLRSAGMWASCPLVATAQDGALPLGRRALAAAAAWAIDRDRQACAVWHCLLPGLRGIPERAAVETLLPPEVLGDLPPPPWSGASHRSSTSLTYWKLA